MSASAIHWASVRPCATRVFTRQELDHEATDPCADQILAEQKAARAPPPPEERAEQQEPGRLVELRRMHRHARRRRSFRERDAPGQVGGSAVVVAHQEATDPPAGLAEGRRRRHAARDHACGQPVDARRQDHQQGSPDQTAVPGDPRPREQQREERRARAQRLVDREVELRADDAADHRVDQDRRGVLGIGAVLAQPARHDPRRHQKANRHHHAERADGEAEDLEQDRIHARGRKWRRA